MSEETENMSTLTGIIVDVSGSVKSSIEDGVHEEGGEWGRSAFTVIDSLIKHDTSDSNYTFAIGVGARYGNGILDVIHTLDYCHLKKCEQENLSFDVTIDRILNILEDCGAVSVRKWALLSVISDAVSHKTATMLLAYLEAKHGFAEMFVNDCLPKICKGLGTIISDRAQANVGGFSAISRLFVSGISNAGSHVETMASTIRPATDREIIEVVEKAKSHLLRNICIPSSAMPVQRAADILHGCVGEKDLTTDRMQELMDTVGRFIYGRTPLYRSLEKASKLFSCSKFREHRKLLFVLSDGIPTDDRNEYFSKLKDNDDVTIVGCFVTKSTSIEPHRLFDAPDENWDNGAKLLFELSSKITTQLIPRTIFVKRGWKIDIDNNETKLFLHVNHPDNMKDACKLARDVICCRDALADALGSVYLDIYINQSTSEFRPQEQVGGTCYANASAVVLHLSMKRILGREGGYPAFDQLRQELIDQYGVHGANTLHVLKRVCPAYRLHCEEVTSRGAMAAVTSNRPAVARFRLTDDEWDNFKDFYQRNPTGILTRQELDITKRPPGTAVFGHAVVFTSYNSKCLRLMNSWGTNWGDMGFFRVQNADILDLEFVDVYWTEKDLSCREKEFYAQHGAENAAKRLRSLKGLQVMTYECPICKVSSKVTEYTGQLLTAECPKCHGSFKCGEPGNILTLNMYLTSLSQE